MGTVSLRSPDGEGARVARVWTVGHPGVPAMHSSRRMSSHGALWLTKQALLPRSDHLFLPLGVSMY